MDKFWLRNLFRSFGLLTVGEFRACVWATSASCKKLVAWSVASSFAAFRECSWGFSGGTSKPGGFASWLAFLKKNWENHWNKQKTKGVVHSRHQQKQIKIVYYYICVERKIPFVFILFPPFPGFPAIFEDPFAVWPVKCPVIFTLKQSVCNCMYI